MTDNNEVVLSITEEAADRAEKMARVLADEKAKADAQAAREEQVAAQTRGVNEAYKAKQDALAKQIEETNARNKAAQAERDKTANERSAAEGKARIEAVHGKQNKPETGFLDAHSLVPAPRKPSIVLQTQPSKYPSSDPRAGLTEALILSFNMDPRPDHPPFAKK